MLILTNTKRDNDNFILLINDQLINMVYYTLMKNTISIVGLLKNMIEVIIHYLSLKDLILSNKGSFFILQLCLLFFFSQSLKKSLLLRFILDNN